MYNRFDTGLLPRENTNDVTLSTLEHIGVLEAHLATLQAVCLLGFFQPLFLSMLYHFVIKSFLEIQVRLSHFRRLAMVWALTKQGGL